MNTKSKKPNTYHPWGFTTTQRLRSKKGDNAISVVRAVYPQQPNDVIEHLAQELSEDWDNDRG